MRRPVMQQETVMPEIRLEHLVRMTDCTGIIQHAVHSLPDRWTGYTTDDNARALIVAIKLHQQGFGEQAMRLAERYLAFVRYAQTPEGCFRNFMDYERRWVEPVGSEDCFGRVLWACAYAVSAVPGSALAGVARRILEPSLPLVKNLRSVRGKAFSILGLYHLVNFDKSCHKTLGALKTTADSLVETYRSCRLQGWYWFEDVITYSNGVVPMALFLSYMATGRRAYLNVASESLGFLTEVVFPSKCLQLVGNRGWYPRGGQRASADEQPVDAAAMVLAYLAASQATGKGDYVRLARDAFAWFMGRNCLGLALYDPTTGGCYDGLTPEGVNLNQGAESLLAYLLSGLSLAETMAKQQAVRSGA